MDNFIDILNISVAIYGVLIGIVKTIGDMRLNSIRRKTRRFLRDMLGYESVLLASIAFLRILPYVIKNEKLLRFTCNTANAVYFTMYYLIFCTFIYYSADYVSKYCGKKIKVAFYTIPVTVISIVLWAISSYVGFFTTFDGRAYVHGPFYYVGQIGGYLLIAEPFYFVWKYRKNLNRKAVIVLYSFVVLPLLGVYLRSRFPGPEYIPFMMMLSLILIDNTVQYEQEMLILEQEDKIARDRIKILFSQIKPHFLYNVLNSIYVLCEKNPEEAQDAIGEFSEYLRANLDSLELEDCIPFDRELKHVETYISLEKMRFREKLNVEYDIREKNFRVPALSIQLLVENAVKHGIHKKQNGGTVKISTYSDNDFYVIVVKDDGTGFDVNNINDDNKSHVGLDNLKERLYRMSGGALLLESTENVGTTATITIPKNI